MQAPTEQPPVAPRRRRSRVWELAVALLVWLCSSPRTDALEVPTWLPRYDLDIDLRLDEQRVGVRERVTWTNPSRRPTSTVVFNVASHYSIPEKDVGFLAKMLEILRLAPSEGLDFGGPACEVQRVHLHAAIPADLPFFWRPDNATALEVQLPFTVGPGESVTLELEFSLRLPQKQGRWGQWRGVTFLAQWLPVVAVHDDHGWQPPPFIPWHQPFYNEAGVYRACITLPADQVLASTGCVEAEKDLGDGRRQVVIGPVPARDFALFCSARYREFTGVASNGVKVRVVAFPEHTFYAQEMVRIACEALPVYGKWFGPFPYPQFTVVDSYFGWNGNECGGLVMIDARIFNFPHLARDFVDYLLSHELCHQWWYNVVGTNGYAETWMDEGVVTHFSHRLINAKLGKNNPLLRWPSGLTWLPNIRREDYRHFGMLGTMGRGELRATVQDLSGFQHLPNLNSMAYDRGSKIVGMIEERLGSDSMLDFMRHVYRKYAFRILRVADFQRELEAYTGSCWEEFFQNWLYRPGMADWCLEEVRIEDRGSRIEDRGSRIEDRGPVCRSTFPKRRSASRDPGSCRVTVLVSQKGECNEPTTLGFALDDPDTFPVRVPILPGAGPVQIDDQLARVESCGAPSTCAQAHRRYRVEVVLPCKPTQVVLDPDQVILDRNPLNNCWKPRVRWRFTPVYTQLEETDLTNAYDRWNFIAGPWVYGAAYRDPWWTRSAMAGVRAGVYRTQECSAGTYLAYRTNDRNVVAGVDGLLDHFPLPRTQVGFHAEYALTSIGDGYLPCSRAVVFGRYVFTYGDSLYLPPFEYIEAFTGAQNRCLPVPNQPLADTDLFNHQTLVGLHYHKYHLTPYWNPEGGLALDATYQAGLPILGAERGFHQVFGQVSWVKGMPAWLGFMREVPALAWLMETRWAFRLFGAAAVPHRGQFFTLGGGEQFRGFDLRERQGSLGWIASVEWRVPLVRGIEWDVCDHVAGLRNIYGALFYDAGDMLVNGHSQGPVAHALGLGLRLDVAWFGLIERTMFRFDVAKTVNVETPWQFWVGIQHPF